MSGLRGILGRKLGMTRVFAADGHAVPVTVLEVGPCTVLQKKTVAREGYNALQLGFRPKAMQRLIRPEEGHVQKAGASHGFYFIREVLVEDPEHFKVGQKLTLKDLDVSDLADVVGVSKGRGYAGTVVRWGFSCGPMRHGSKHHREMGSVGQSASPSRVIKGKKMPGRRGGKRSTIRNVIVVDVRPEENLMLVRGGVPGAANQFVCLKCR